MLNSINPIQLLNPFSYFLCLSPDIATLTDNDIVLYSNSNASKFNCNTILHINTHCLDTKFIFFLLNCYHIIISDFKCFIDTFIILPRNRQ